MGEIIQLPVSKGSEETYGYVPSEKVLTKALEKNLEDVIVLGWDGEELYAASSSANIGNNLYIIERFKQLLMQREE